MFNQYKFSPMDVSEWALQAARALAQSQPGKSASVFAGEVIAARLRARPAAYLEFGPYWWGVKAALLKLGHDFGPSTDVAVLAEYGGDMPAYGALVAGERFKDYYRSTFLAGSRDLWLHDQGAEPYVLSDPDMEARVSGLPGPMTGPTEAEADGGSDAVMDSVQEVAVPATPFRVTFEMDGDVWSANLYCDGIDTARDRVKALEQGGQIGRAVDAAKGIRPLPERDQGVVADVDLKGRRVLIG
jgi:hypothetical protein